MVVKRPMVAFLTRLLLAIRSRLTQRARLEAENLLSRQQLIVSTAQVPDACETMEHRSLALGMAVSTLPVAHGRDHHRPPGDRAPLVPTRFPRLLALEVLPRRRASKRHYSACVTVRDTIFSCGRLEKSRFYAD